MTAFSREAACSHGCSEGEAMFLSQQAQLLAVLQSVLLGVGISVFYDVMGAWRHYTKAGPWVTALCDALFWVVLLAALFEFSLAVAPGQSRYYVLAGAAFGGIVYFGLVSELVQGLLRTLFSLISWLIGLVRRAATMVRDFLHVHVPYKKISDFVKKFAKRPSIFRRKGIK